MAVDMDCINIVMKDIRKSLEALSKYEGPQIDLSDFYVLRGVFDELHEKLMRIITRRDVKKLDEALMEIGTASINALAAMFSGD